MRVISTTVDYTWLGKLENELRSSIYQIKEIQYLDQVIILVYVEETQKETYTAWITELTNGQGHITEEEMLYLEEEFSWWTPAYFSFLHCNIIEKKYLFYEIIKSL